MSDGTAIQPTADDRQPSAVPSPIALTDRQLVEFLRREVESRDATILRLHQQLAAANPARVAGGFADGGPVQAPVTAGEFDRQTPAAQRRCDWPEPPDYGRPPTRTGELPLEIDEQIAGSLAARNQILRRQCLDALDRARRAEARVAELELTLRAVGGAIRHANQRAAQADESAGSGEEGGE